jgi:hypothetical protein
MSTSRGAELPNLYAVEHIFLKSAYLNLERVCLSGYKYHIPLLPLFVITQLLLHKNLLKNLLESKQECRVSRATPFS